MIKFRTKIFEKNEIEIKINLNRQEKIPFLRCRRRLRRLKSEFNRNNNDDNNMLRDKLIDDDNNNNKY